MVYWHFTALILIVICQRVQLLGVSIMIMTVSQWIFMPAVPTVPKTPVMFALTNCHVCKLYVYITKFTCNDACIYKCMYMYGIYECVCVCDWDCACVCGVCVCVTVCVSLCVTESEIVRACVVCVCALTHAQDGSRGQQLRSADIIINIISYKLVVSNSIINVNKLYKSL